MDDIIPTVGPITREDIMYNQYKSNYEILVGKFNKTKRINEEQIYYLSIAFKVADKGDKDKIKVKNTKSKMKHRRNQR